MTKKTTRCQANHQKKKTVFCMEQYKIGFESMKWELPAGGVRFNLIVENCLEVGYSLGCENKEGGYEWFE